MLLSRALTALQQTGVAVILLAAATLLLYGHTLDVPMYLDDISSISDNPAIADAGAWGRIFAFSEMRFVGYLSFALNYQAHGEAVAGYHIVNLLIHIGAGLTLYLLVLALGRTPALRASELGESLPLLALGAALLFLIHPLHTQAVTYIVQRLASLVALFYLLSIYAYVQGRLSLGSHRAAWFAACGLAAVLALFTKQNAVTLPAALVLVEFCFFAGEARERRRLLLIAVACLLAVLVTVLLLHVTGVFSLEQLDSATRETARLSRADYLASQLIVVWRYLGLFAWPNPLVLDYGLQPLWQLGDWQVVLSGLGHLFVMVGALTLTRRAPLVAFGILFYYLTHSVESGLIPIKDLMFEHRAYLPDAGLSIALLAALAAVPRRIVVPIFLLGLLALSVLTWQRNQLWRDQVAFFNHAIAHAPDQPRNWIYLAKVYHKAGENQQALYFLTEELRANEERYGRLRVDTATLVFWAKLLRVTGQHEMADRVESDLAATANPLQRQRVLLHKGNAFLESGEYDQAADAYREVLRINPGQTSAAINLGVVALLQEDYAAAISIFERYPTHPVSKANLPRARAALAGEYRFEGLEEKVIEKSR